MLTARKIDESKKPVQEKKDPSLDVSFCVTQLSQHNNCKAGFWVALNGFVYDITKSIDSFPELIPHAGTDITHKFPDLSDKLSHHLIGRLLNPKDKAKEKVRDILYKNIIIQNELDSTLSNKKGSDYKDLYIKCKTAIESTFIDLTSLLSPSKLQSLQKAIENFELLNIMFNSTEKTEKDYYQILFNYKGIANLIKFMLEEYIARRANHSVFEDDLTLLANTEKEDALILPIKDFLIRKKQDVTIVGGSIVGITLAMQLKKLGLDVTVYDKYDDPRIKYADHASASFNIFISERGLCALDSVGLKGKFLDIALPTKGRDYHYRSDDSKEDVIKEDLNGPNKENLNLVRREGLLNLLITEAEKMGVVIKFDVDCKTIKVEESGATIDAVHVYSNRNIKIETDVVFAADGSNSSLRKVIDGTLSADEKSTTVLHKQIYREFMVPADEKGESRFDNTKLQVWPRDGFTFVAFANEDKSFSLTLFIDKSRPELPRLQEDTQYLDEFIKNNFPELYPILHKIVLNEPPKRWGVLTKVDAKKWHLGGHLTLIGDSAHGCYPFNGQAANCGMEDTVVLRDLIEKQLKDKKITIDSPSFNWEEIFCEFSKRKIDTDTMANYTKAPPVPGTKKEFELRKLIEFELIKQGIPSFFYVMNFTTLPFSKGMELSLDHEPLLSEIFDILNKKDRDVSADDVMIETTAAIARKRAKDKLTEMTKVATSPRDRFFGSSHDGISETAKLSSARPIL